MTYRRSAGDTHSDATIAHPVLADDDFAHEEREVHEAYSDAVAADRIASTSVHESLTGRVNAILWAILLGLETLLALRFVQLAFGANLANGFVDFVMDVSWPFVRPFDGAFASRTWDEGIVEVSTLLAMVVWFVVFALISILLNAILPNIAISETRTNRRHTEHM